jgi:cytochrome bd-type quinol oxidase subunit 1
MSPRVRLLLALALDAALVLAFALLGRKEHDDTSASRDAVVIAMPFWFGLLAGWVGAKVWREPWAIRTGLLIWPAVIVVGMLTRRWVFGDGTAAAFVIVATLFLGAGLAGWRALAWLTTRDPAIAGPL